MGAFTARLRSGIANRGFPRRNPTNLVAGYPKNHLPKDANCRRKIDGLRYLAGQGLYGKVAVLDSECSPIYETVTDRSGKQIKRPQTSNQDLRASIPQSQSQWLIEAVGRFPLDRPIAENSPTLLDAFQLMGLLGGLGARSRRGFGSLALTQLKGGPSPNKRTSPFPIQPSDVQEYTNSVMSLFQTISQANGDEAPYSVLGENEPAFVFSETGENLASFHNRMGELFQNFRSDRMRFWNDHQWFVTVSDPDNFLQDHPSEAGKKVDAPYPVSDLAANGGGQLPQRSLFGLPHNYYSGNKSREYAPRQTDVTASVMDGNVRKTIDRRASPLFLHLHESGGIYVAVWFKMDGAFLPSGALLTIDPRAGSQAHQQKRNQPWDVPFDRSSMRDPVTEFLEHVRTQYQTKA
jgi:hypothetical protein